MDDKQTQKVTLEDLAGMVQRGFAEAVTKVELEHLETNVAREFTKMADRLEDVETRLTGIEARLDRMDLRERVERIAQVIREKLHVDV